MSNSQQSRDQVFICYRRDDSGWFTGRIYDRLVQQFGEETVFKDIDSIPLGTNFKQHIDSILRQCTAVLVVIGENWLSNRRIDDPRDHVRIELESALARAIPVIPLLVQNASMPAAEELPESLRELVYRNGISISNDPHFHVDMNRLIKSLERYLTPNPSAIPRSSLTKRGSILRWRSVLIGSIVVLGLSLAFFLYWREIEWRKNNDTVQVNSPTPTPSPLLSPTQSSSPVASPETHAPAPSQSQTPRTASPTTTPSAKSTPTNNSTAVRPNPTPAGEPSDGVGTLTLSSCIQKKITKCKGGCVLNSFGDIDIGCEEDCSSTKSRNKFESECKRGQK